MQKRCAFNDMVSEKKNHKDSNLFPHCIASEPTR